MNEILNNGEVIINEQEATTLYRDICSLLKGLEYVYSKNSIEKIITMWAKNKSALIKAFKQHPCYVPGKFAIVNNGTITRTSDEYGVKRFFDDFLSSYRNIRAMLKEEYQNEATRESCNIPSRLDDMFYALKNYSQQHVDEHLEESFWEYFPELKIKAGQKTSRAANKLFTLVGIADDVNYNKEFAKYSDALNPIEIKVVSVLSINPLDYLTMSFGNSWSSCHTIDINNTRNLPNGYRGQYSTGTLSYLMDASTMVFYNVNCENDDFIYQDKIKRQMFHYQNGILIQGRLYPQTNDNGSSALYNDNRTLVRSIIKECFQLEDSWELKEGRDECSKYTESYGSHYRDYLHFDQCNVSLNKQHDNTSVVKIGHSPFDIETGEDLEDSERLSLKRIAGRRKCCHCGDVRRAKDLIKYKNFYYCDYCTVTCENCGERTPDYKNFGRKFLCKECAKEYEICFFCKNAVEKTRLIHDKNGLSCCCNCRSKVEIIEHEFLQLDSVLTCDICGKKHNEDAIKEIDYIKYCPTCYTECF